MGTRDKESSFRVSVWHNQYTKNFTEVIEVRTRGASDVEEGGLKVSERTQVTLLKIPKEIKGKSPESIRMSMAVI